MFLLRIRHKTGGAHVHADFYIGQGSTPETITPGRCGSLAFRKEEWEVFLTMLTTGSVPSGSICEVIDEDTGKVRGITGYRQEYESRRTQHSSYSTDQGEPLVRGMPGHPDNDMGM